MIGSTIDIAVVGGGIAALTAAYHAGVGGCSVTLLSDADPMGGLVTNVGELDGFPAIGTVAGAELAQHLLEQVKALGVTVVRSRVDGITAMGSAKMLRSGTQTWRAKQVIAATGARLVPLDVPGADRFRDQGLLQCAWCNAGLYRGRNLVVVGGGDSALQEALHLAKYADSVTIVTRGERFRARQTYVDRAAGNDKLSFRWAVKPVAIRGETRIEALQIQDLQSGALEDLACDAVFAYPGVTPNSEWLGELVDRDERGGVVTGSGCSTRTPGLFAVGAVRSGYAGRLTNAVGEATEAAIRAVAAVTA
jgi:thioredoxin reductase (NADPH)